MAGGRHWNAGDHEMRALLCCEIVACFLAVGSASAQVDSSHSKPGFEMSRYLGQTEGLLMSSGAYGSGLAAYRPLHDDAIRYLGILGATTLALHFYGFDPSG